MQKKTKLNTYGIAFTVAYAVVAVMIIIATVWSIVAANNNVDQAVDKLSEFYMEELVDKRETVLRDSLNKDFEQLDRTISLLESSNIQDVETLREFLSDAQTLFGAKRLAVVDEDNTVYTAHSTFSDASRYTYFQENFNEPQIVTSNLYGAKKQVVVAVPVDSVALQGKKIVACFMQLDIDDVVGSLAYEEKKTSGSTYIGLYYKNGENLTTSEFDDIEPGQNLLEYIRVSHLSDEQSYEATAKSFREGEKGLVTIEADGETKYIYYVPVEGTDWMLTVMVRDNTIADQLEYTSEAMLRRTVIQLVCTTVVIVAIFLIIGLLNKRNSEMRRRQNELEVKAQNEEELRIARDEAEKASNAKTAFLFNMSHDIRTPMNAILGYTDIGLSHADDAARATESFMKIKTSGGHLLSLINDILEMSRIESGKLDLAEHEVDIREAIDGIDTMGQALALPKSIDFETVIGEIRNQYIYADELHINEVIINLISNAVKYTHDGGKVRYNISQISDVTDGEVTFRFEVTDTGIGMSEEFQSHIFEAFTRESNASVSRTEGAGLGLSIVKNIVEIAGGTISVSSAPGKGSSFTVEIPFRVMDDEAIERYKEEKNNKVKLKGIGELEGRKILLVEDNEINREIATVFLEDAGFTVDIAQDGEIAVKTVKDRGVDYYDFILMDIQMPVMNGYEATKAIRELQGGGKLKIIALSANAFEEDRQKSISVGMNAHVAKPLDINELIKSMQQLI